MADDNKMIPGGITFGPEAPEEDRARMRRMLEGIPFAHRHGECRACDDAKAESARLRAEVESLRGALRTQNDLAIERLNRAVAAEAWQLAVAEAAEARLRDVQEALRGAAQRKLSDGTLCFCLDGDHDAARSHYPHCERARDTLASGVSPEEGA